MIKTKIIVKPKDGNSSSGSVTEGSYGSGYADYAASAGRSKQSDRSALATLAETAISAYRAKRADMASELDPDSETLQGYVLKEWLGKLLSVVDVDGTEQDINGTVGDGMKIMPHLGLTSIDVSGDGHISLGGMQMVYDAAHGAWRLDGSLYVTGGLSALGNSDVAGGGGGGLDAELLWSLLGNRGTEQISKSHLADALAGYATEEWVEGRGYLTNRDAYTKAEIDAKDWSSNKGTVTSVGIAMPTGFSVSGSPITEKGILAIGFATGYSLPTTAKQSNWDTVYNWYSGITGSDTDTIINKWGEIISFLDGIEDTATLSGIVNGINQSITDESNRAKAEEQSLSKSITDEVSRAKAAEQALTSSISTNTSAINVLKGYFTNGVAKSAVKLQTARKIWGNTFDGTQDVAGDLILPNGKKIVIGTASLSWDADNNAVKIDGSVYATGGLSALGNSDTTGGGGGGLMGTIVPYAKAIALTTQNEGAEIASAWSVKMLYDKIENVDVSGQLTSYLTKQEARTLYQPVGNYLTAHQSLDGYVNGIAVEGTGNAVTTVAKSGKTVIFTKGANYLTGITKAQVEGVLTGNITSHTHSQYLTSHQDISGKADRSELLGYLPLSGGTMTGGISWLSESALPNSSSADYLLVIDAFANGGRMKWINTSTLRVSQLTNDAGYVTASIVNGYATQSWVSNNYLPLTGGTLSGNLNLGSNTLFAENLSLTNVIDNWNFNHSENRLRFIYCTNKAAIGAPERYCSGISALTGYTGFQLVTYGGDGEELFFRKTQDNNLWHDWYRIYHEGFKPTKADVGLGNVDNTADANKSVSYATTAGSANSVAWSNVSGRPTRLSDFTDDVVSGKYLSLSTGGTVQGGVIFNDVVSFGEYQDFNYGPCSCTRPNTDDYSCYSFVSTGVKPYGLGYDTSYRIILGQPINNGGKGWRKKWLQIGEDATIAENFIANNSIQCNGQGSFNSLQIGNITIIYDAANKGLRIAGGGLYTDSYLSSLGVDASTALSVKKWADSINLTEESDAELATAYSIGNLYRMINSNQESITQSLNQSVSALQGRCTSLEQRVSALENKVNK